MIRFPIGNFERQIIDCRNIVLSGRQDRSGGIAVERI